MTATYRSLAGRRAPRFGPPLKWISILAVALVLASCGGGGSGAPAPADTPSAVTAPVTVDPALAGANVLPITVDRGTDGSAINLPFVTVTVCQPGTDICQTIDHVMVDTGSSGLRLNAASVGAAGSLPAVVTASGAGVGECAQFASGYMWGSVRRADVRLAGERADGIALQVVGDPAAAYANAPTACRRTGAAISVGPGTNGILGVGMSARDCGSACVSSTSPGVYYACPTSGCMAATLPLASQVANPVASFATDNNGVALVLPAVPAGGARTLAGSLVFGIDTQANNQLGAATVFQVNSQGNFKTTYKGTSYASSFIDSGSNAIFFADASIPVCSGFFCPLTALSLTAVNTSATGVSGTVNFTVERVDTLAPDIAAAHLGADFGLSGSFDWGLPFFFGRTVFVAMVGAPTSKGAGPFWAY